jgi:hypothetical protein
MDIKAAVVMNCEPVWFGIHSYGTGKGNKKLVMAMLALRTLPPECKVSVRTVNALIVHGQFLGTHKMLSKFTMKVWVYGRYGQSP